MNSVFFPNATLKYILCVCVCARAHVLPWGRKGGKGGESVFISYTTEEKGLHVKRCPFHSQKLTVKIKLICAFIGLVFNVPVLWAGTWAGSGSAGSGPVGTGPAGSGPAASGPLVVKAKGLFTAKGKFWPYVIKRREKTRRE